jgi:hypothetical protein
MKTDTIEAQRVAPEGVRLPDEANDVRVMSSRVDEGYFETLRIPIVAGRGFEISDREDTRNVAVVNQAFVERYWPGQNRRTTGPDRPRQSRPTARGCVFR